jgi:hypothetical protein
LILGVTHVKGFKEQIVIIENSSQESHKLITRLLKQSSIDKTIVFQECYLA